MRSSTFERRALARDVRFTAAELVVELTDGRTVMTPLAWYPRLLHATKTQRAHWRLIGRGVGVHWEDVDEDLSIDGMLRGDQSQESPTSLARARIPPAKSYSPSSRRPRDRRR